MASSTVSSSTINGGSGNLNGNVNVNMMTSEEIKNEGGDEENGQDSSGVSSATAADGSSEPASAKTDTLATLLSSTPSWQMDLLMQKLKQKAGQLKPLVETAKNIRSALLERRCILDPGNKLHLQKCLDQLQQSIKVNSLQSMVERLEMISRQQGLKFHPGATGNEWFISSDMFYLELLIDPNGVVQDVKIQHDGKAEQVSCPEIVDSLKKNDFADFTLHLEGLVSIYQLNADKKIKSKAFIALQALETDLSTMASTYSHIVEGDVVVMKSLLGLLQSRKGGHPVRLTFYITPYEFLDLLSDDPEPNQTFDTKIIAENKLGTSATISIQPFSSHKLQMNTIVSVARLPEGKSVPRYGVLNATNSTALPACFSINLKKGIPICNELLELIQANTGIQVAAADNDALPQPILSLISQHASNGALDCGDDCGLFVSLLDQMHCYYMTQTPNLEGIVVSNISFTLASQVPPVLNILRQQLTFNTLVASCVRVGTKPDMDHIVFEVNALSHKNLAVSFQHPLEESLVTLEFDLKDVSHPQCHLHAVTNVADIIPTLEEHACKALQKSMSIPVTLRAVIRRWQSLKPKFEPPNPEHLIPVGGAFGGKNLSHSDLSCGAESERLAQQQQQQTTQQQIPGMVMNLGSKKTGSSSGGGRSPAYTISPVTTPTSTSAGSGSAFPMAQNLDLLQSYMNPLFPMNMNMNFANLPGLTFQNLQSFPPSPAKMALQMNLLANQIQQQQQQGGAAAAQKSSALLMGLMDQVGQRGRRRKRKGMSSDSAVPSTSGSNNNSGQQQRLSPGRRRPSEGSEGTSSPEGRSTPQTAIGLLMSELGLENPDPRWNIDITPVTPTTTTSDSTFMASKLLSSFGNNSEGFGESGEGGEFSLPKGGISSRRPRDFPPKRSMSLDSSQLQLQMQMQGLDDSAGSSSNLQGLGADSSNFKPLMTPSLSITPVSTNSSGSALGSSAVNSLLANIRPGIEIIPLPNPVQIPNSITVTPILPKVTTAATTATTDKKGGTGMTLTATTAKKSDDGGSGSDPTRKKILSSEKKDRKRKLGPGVIVEEDGSGGAKQLKLMSGYANIGNPLKPPANPAATRPNFALQLKKQMQQQQGQGQVSLLNRAPLMKSASASPTSALASKIAQAHGQGKPSVSTLKSVSGSPKFQADGTATAKPKIIKDKLKIGNFGKVGVAKSLSFPGLGISGSGSSPGGMPLVPPTLKAIDTASTTSSGMNMFFSGIQQQMAKGGQGLDIQQKATAAAATSKAGQSSGQGSTCTTPTTPTLVGNKKAGGLAAVIDKLKSQYSGDGDKPPGEQKGKNGNGNGGGLTPTGQGQGQGQEYIVKQNTTGQGLKLTINKTAKALGKDKLGKPGSGTGVKSPGQGQGIKRPMMGPKVGGQQFSPKPSGGSGGIVKKKAVEKEASSPSGGNSGSKPSAPAKTEETIDLTKKLFMPGAVRSLESGMFDGPKFDSNFQIPKKSRTQTPPTIERSDSKTDLLGGTEKVKGTTASLEKQASVEAPQPSVTPDPIVTVNTAEPTSETTRNQNEAEDLTTTAQTQKDSPVSTNEGPMNLSATATAKPEEIPEVIPEQQPSEPASLVTKSPETVAVAVTSAAAVETPLVADTPKSPIETFVSPESPDPIAFMEEDSVYKPPTIPTTPQRATPAPTEEATVPVAPTPGSPPSPEDDDHLIMDIPSDNSCSSLKIPESIGSGSGISASASPKEGAESVGAEEAAPGPAPIVSVSVSVPPAAATTEPMPPPPPPSSLLLDNLVTSPGAPVPIVSVHIVHSPSPQPNSPALLRSPLIVASPLAVDDDLMDEAVIGTGN